MAFHKGQTVEAARANLIEALELFFESADPTEIARRLHTGISVTRVTAMAHRGVGFSGFSSANNGAVGSTRGTSGQAGVAGCGAQFSPRDFSMKVRIW
jgi:hypothetical protein